MPRLLFDVPLSIAISLSNELKATSIIPDSGFELSKLLFALLFAPLPLLLPDHSVLN